VGLDNDLKDALEEVAPDDSERDRTQGVGIN
jgi:hypothetical protein